MTNQPGGMVTFSQLSVIFIDMYTLIYIIHSPIYVNDTTQALGKCHYCQMCKVLYITIFSNGMTLSKRKSGREPNIDSV
jgi:hypothetical protein